MQLVPCTLSSLKKERQLDFFTTKPISLRKHGFPLPKLKTKSSDSLILAINKRQLQAQPIVLAIKF